MTKPGDGWERHGREQLHRWRELSPQQRLDWLWQAKQFAAKAAQAHAAKRAQQPDRPPGNDQKKTM